MHSHEEDEGDKVVLRRPDHPFPPARGRAALTLQPDGGVSVQHPGPDDRPVSTAGDWSLDGDRLRIFAPWLAGEYDVESVRDDTLVLRRR